MAFRNQSDGLVDDEARRYMRLVVPHIPRAALVGKVLDLKARNRKVRRYAEEMSAGIFFVDTTCQCRESRDPSKANILCTASGRLAMHDPQTDQILTNTFTIVGNGDAAIRIKGILGRNRRWAEATQRMFT